MSTPLSFYNEELLFQQEEAKKYRKSIIQLSLLRLAIFIIAALLIYFFWGNYGVILPMAIVVISLFLFLIKKHVDLKEKRDLARALTAINEEEIAIAHGDFHSRANGLEHLKSNHYYSLDIDLFGQASFYQFINRTETNEGSALLGDLFQANDINEIPKRQAAIKELSTLVKWRQHFAATARLIKVETTTDEIVDWLLQYKKILPSWAAWLPIVFGILSIGVISLLSLGIIPEIIFLIWFFIGLGIVGKYTKQINVLSKKIDEVKDTIRQYSALLKQIEAQVFTAPLLQEKKEKIKLESTEASKIFKDFTKKIDRFDSRKNILSAIVSNGLMLFDLQQTYKIEQWILQHNNKIKDWLETIAFFDAYNSLGNYTYNHVKFSFPKIEEGMTTLDCKELGHPLIQDEKRVNNTIKINKDEFFIITGANMAGKSTFLRTIALHIVMANMGLPVCAKESRYVPIKLISSMRTEDSLASESSYFFAELSRLKFIVEQIKDEAYFIILDEILKGTNSTDKAIGSKKFVERLVSTKATGIIATHDLSLCTIEKELDEVQNYYFDAAIIDDELHFDYTFKKGICQNMNASFLLKKMDII